MRITFNTPIIHEYEINLNIIQHTSCNIIKHNCQFTRHYRIYIKIPHTLVVLLLGKNAERVLTSSSSPCASSLIMSLPRLSPRRCCQPHLYEIE